MGTWGIGHFENDAAFDFMADVEAADDPKQLFNETFDIALGSEFLETDEGTAVIIASTYIDRQLNGTRYSSDETDGSSDVDTFPERHPGRDLSDLRQKAMASLQQVLGDHSELNQLWAENEEDFPAWRAGVEELIERLVDKKR